MEIGTHNSMTYLKPKKWYMYPFQFIAKCQSLSIKHQYEKGIRLFDIRISYDKEGNPEFKHGLIAYEGDVYKTLDWLNNRGESIKIRILLEENKANLLNEIFFIHDIKEFISKYKNLTFYEGRRKFDWAKLLDIPDLQTIQLVSSMRGSKLCPWLYAKIYNKKNLKNYKDEYPVLIDFYK